MELDHVVLWVSEPEASLAFYTAIVGLRGVRVEEFRAGTAPFVSVHINDGSILDLMPQLAAAMVRAMTGERIASGAGQPLNHLCLSMTLVEWEGLRQRLDAADVPVQSAPRPSFGARGVTTHWFYFQDPDGNVIEARAY